MKRPVAFVVLAGVAALLASVLVYSALKKREAEVKAATASTCQIVVAAHDLPLGAKVDAAAVKMARWSADSVPPGAITDPNGALNAFVKSSIVENEPLVASKLFTGDKTAGVMPLLIPPGMRAVSVPVDEVADIAGFVLPHARVDILASIVAGNGNPKTISKIVLQNVEVLAIAQEIEGKKDEPEVVRVVTVLVSPPDAEKLALASHEGSLRLAMRNYNDDKLIVTAGADMESLLSNGRTTMPVMARQPDMAHEAIPTHVRPTVQIEIMRDGKSRQSVSFIRQAAIGPTSGRSRSGISAGASDEDSLVPDAQTTADGANGAGVPPQEVPATSEAPIPTHASFAPIPKTIDVP
jgi:pilus assembly protein CpaB